MMGSRRFELSQEEMEQMAEEAVRKGVHGNHSAFAELFLTLSCTRKEIFQRKMVELYTSYAPMAVCRRETIQNDKKLRFMKREYWRDGRTEYRDASKDCFYGKAYALDRLNGAFGSSRELLLQLAICLGLTPTEADSFLMAAGESMLYILDPVDAATLFYLKRFHEEEKEGQDYTPSEKLAIVKSAQNILLQRLEGKKNVSYKRQEVLLFSGEMDSKNSSVSIREDFCEEERNFIRCLEKKTLHMGACAEFTEKEVLRYGICLKGNTGNYYIGLPKYAGNTAESTERYFVWNPAKRQLLRFTAKSFAQQGFSQELSLGIDEEMERLKDQFEKNKDLRETVETSGDLGSTTLYLTRLFERISQKAATFEEFMDFGNKENMGTVFAEKCYGFLRKTRQFLDEEGSYRKYLFPSTEKLSLRRNFFVDVGRGPADEEPDASRQSKIQTIDKIMSMYMTKKMEPQLPERSAGAWNMTAQLLNGREQSSPSGGTRFFTFEKKPKNILMRFALSTGNEDELSEYLQLAGYWSTDWVRWIEEGGEKPEAPEELDLTDYLCLYAFACRKQYLMAWEESVKKARTFALTPFLTEQRSDFPMVPLILLIEAAILKALDDKKQQNKTDWENRKKQLVKDVFLFSNEEKI